MSKLNWPDHADYQAARPFPHAVIDEFVAPWVARDIADEFPPLDVPCWHHFSSPVEDKWQMSNPAHFRSASARLHRWLVSPGVERNIARMVGVDSLRGSVFGGGYHRIDPGGFLGMHTDSLHDPSDGVNWEPNWYRCVNLLLFLTNNEFDTSAWLRLECDGMTQGVAPLPGRCAIFTTDAHSLHGHPKPLDGDVRKSFAVYYYSERPPPWWTGDQPTTFVEGDQ